MANMTTQEILQGIKDWAAPKVIYDISAAHNNTKYTDLADALGTNGGNIPQEYKKGGITVRFVHTSDNKYVQYRLMSDTFNTTSANWQGVDDEPTVGSDNLVKSGGVYSILQDTLFSLKQWTVSGNVNYDSNEIPVSCNIKWSDGTEGTLVYSNFDYDAYEYTTITATYNDKIIVYSLSYDNNGYLINETYNIQ